MNLRLDSILAPDALNKVLGVFRTGPSDEIHQRRGKWLLTGLLLVSLAGAAAIAVAFLGGHHVMGTTSEVPWGVLIASYVFFVVSSTGLCLVSSLGHVFGFKLFEPIAKKAIFLALVTLLVGFSVIASELERPVLLLRLAILSPNPRSPIWWMGTLYGVYMILIATELYFLFIANHARARAVGLASVLAAVAAHSNLGAVFGMSHARAWWYGPLLPVYFIASALVCGAALLILMIYLGDYFGNNRRLRPANQSLLDALRQLLVLFLAIVAFLTVWKFLLGLGGEHEHKYEVSMAILTGPLFVSFWGIEIFFGLLVPLALLLVRQGRSPGRVAFAAGAAMGSVFVVRYNFVYTGQMFSLRPLVGHLGERLTYSPPFKGGGAGFLPYAPSLVEILVVVGAISAAVLLFVAGWRALRLSPETGQEAST